MEGERSSSSKWLPWFGAIAAVFGIGMVIVGWFITFIHLEDANTNLQSRVSALELASAQEGKEQEKSKIDRASLDKNVAALEGKFCEEDNIRNLMHAYDNRMMAVLWRRLFDMDFPINNSFYPFVCESAGSRGEAGPG